MKSVLADQPAIADRKAIRVAAFTGGATISSRRFRVQQYVSRLHEFGVEISEFVARFGSWPPNQKLLRPLWLGSTLLSRLPSIASSQSYDVTLLQREMVSTLITLEPLTPHPRVLDVDDAVWLNPRSEKSFPRLVRICDGIICGNSFIAENVEKWNKNLTILPTAVDADRFHPVSSPIAKQQRSIIGWSGLHAGFKYLLGIEPALIEVLKKRPDAVLRIVSDVKPKFRGIDELRIEYIPWSPENEVATIQQMNLGLMPIDDSLWSRGKCSYKMLLYMACGVPVVVSPYGMNKEVLARGDGGIQPHNFSEWIDAMLWLLDHPDRAQRMGEVGRQIVEKYYSLAITAPQMAYFLRQFSTQTSGD